MDVYTWINVMYPPFNFAPSSFSTTKEMIAQGIGQMVRMNFSNTQCMNKNEINSII
jgi:hypothetical protein